MECMNDNGDGVEAAVSVNTVHLCTTWKPAVTASVLTLLVAKQVINDWNQLLFGMDYADAA